MLGPADDMFTIDEPLAIGLCTDRNVQSTFFQLSSPNEGPRGSLLFIIRSPNENCVPVIAGRSNFVHHHVDDDHGSRKALETLEGRHHSRRLCRLRVVS